MVYESILLTDLLEKRFGEIRCRLVGHKEDVRECFLTDPAGRSLAFAVTFFPEKGPLEGRAAEAHTEIRNGALIGKTLRSHGFRVRKRSLEIATVSIPVRLKEAFQCDNELTRSFFYELNIHTDSLNPFTYCYTAEVYNPILWE